MLKFDYKKVMQLLKTLPYLYDKWITNQVKTSLKKLQNKKTQSETAEVWSVLLLSYLAESV